MMKTPVRTPNNASRFRTFRWTNSTFPAFERLAQLNLTSTSFRFGGNQPHFNVIPAQAGIHKNLQ